MSHLLTVAFKPVPCSDREDLSHSTKTSVSCGIHGILHGFITMKAVDNAHPVGKEPDGWKKYCTKLSTVTGHLATLICWSTLLKILRATQFVHSETQKHGTLPDPFGNIGMRVSGTCRMAPMHGSVSIA